MSTSDLRIVSGIIRGIRNSTALTGTPSYTHDVEIDGVVHQVIVGDPDAIDECDLLDRIHAQFGTDGHEPFEGRTLTAAARDDGNAFSARVSDISWR
jgi:hypothetical protein